MSEEQTNIKIVVMASSGNGKTTMCGLISELLRAHGFDVTCDDEDIKHHINIMDDQFSERLDYLLGREPKIDVVSQQLQRSRTDPWYKKS